MKLNLLNQSLRLMKIHLLKTEMNLFLYMILKMEIQMEIQTKIDHA